MNAFYSRRIGRPPTGASLAQDNYAGADVPDATTILGAAKITGRTQSGFTLGLLNAVTGRAMADVQSANGASRVAGGRAAGGLLRRSRQTRFSERQLRRGR